MFRPHTHERATPRRAPTAVATLVLLLPLLAACSIKQLAINKIGDALAGGGTTFSSDNDPELVRQAVPFSLKLIESLLAEAPNHRGLLLAASSGFTQYAYAYVQQDAERIEDRDFAEAERLRERARKLYLRARDYGLRGLELRHPGITQALRQDPRATMRTVKREDVAFLYWTAASWGAAISISKDNPDLIADQVIVEALMDESLKLDETFESGALHGFLIAYEGARQGAQGDSADRARRHFHRAVELTGGQMASPFVSLAENVAVSKQNRAEFESLLKRAIEINPDARPEWRLVNLIMQQRARWLLEHADLLFADGAENHFTPAPPLLMAPSESFSIAERFVRKEN